MKLGVSLGLEHLCKATKQAGESALPSGSSGRDGVVWYLRLIQCLNRDLKSSNRCNVNTPPALKQTRSTHFPLNPSALAYWLCKSSSGKNL